MALSEDAQRKALDFIEDIYQQVQPDANTNTGSAIRSLMMIPFSATFASVFQEMEAARKMFLGNFEDLTAAEMDRLGEEQFVERPQGTRSTTQLEIYLEQAEAFTLRAFPYFESEGGTRFRPISQIQFGLNDILEKNGELFVRVPVISEDYGPSSEAGAEEITNFDNLPVDVTRITNPAPTQGGAPRASNSEYFRLIQNAQNDGGIDQANGLLELIAQTYNSVLTTEIVEAGDERMMRGEVWTVDKKNPIRRREGLPWSANNPTFKRVDFSDLYGRATTNFDLGDEWREGRRVKVENDPTHFFRTIKKVPRKRELVLTGNNLIGERKVTLLGEGPEIRDVSDVYMQIPALEVQSTIIDDSYLLEVTQDTSQGSSEIPFTIPEGFGFNTLPDTGKLVIAEGTSSEETQVVADVTDDSKIKLQGSTNQDISKGTKVKLYNMGKILAKELERPVVYILRVDQVDPTSREIDQEISRSQPGDYSEPGWYWEHNDPATLFSPREDKAIQLDEKRHSNAFRGLKRNTDIESLREFKDIKGQRSYRSAGDQLSTSGPEEDFINMDGREAIIELNDTKLNNNDLTKSDATLSANNEELTIPAMNAQFFTKKGYRDQGVKLTLRDKDNGDQIISTYDDVHVRGERARRENSAEFDANNVASNYTVDVTFSGNHTLHDNYPSMSGDVELIILRPVDKNNNGTHESVNLIGGPIVAVHDKNGFINRPTITLKEEYGEMTSHPVRIIYATHSDIRDLQTILDSGQERLLNDDTLARSMRPSLIDASISYSGDSSPDTIRQKFVNLISEAVRNHPDEDVRLDISNVIARLDEEGFADWFDVDPEIRITNILQDGTKEVRYLNPSPQTKQKMLLLGDTPPTPPASLIVAFNQEAPPPGRGILYMGTNNPTKQEYVPYEAVIETTEFSSSFPFLNDDETVYYFIIRDGWGLQDSYEKFDSVFVTSRDYAPELEFQGQSIVLPSENRPYVRQLVIQRGDSSDTSSIFGTGESASLQVSPS